MPKLPGRKETRTRAKIEDLVVGSFIMESEVWLWRRVCVVEGCDHRMGPDASKMSAMVEWRSCDERHLPAWAAHDNERLGYPPAGQVCPCHVREILSRDVP